MAKNQSEFVVRDDVSCKGLRRLHVLRTGEAVDQDRWLQEKEIGEEDLEARLAYEEAELGVWHLRLYWREQTG